MDQAEVVPHREIVAFVLDRRLHGLGSADRHPSAGISYRRENQLVDGSPPPFRVGPATRRGLLSAGSNWTLQTFLDSMRFI